MRLLLLVRHGESLFNVEGVVNGDPALDRGLSDAGRAAATALGVQLQGIRIDLCVTSRFPRAQETARLALGAERQALARVVDEDLDDVRIGELEGRTLAEYRAWKGEHTRSDRFPGGESLDEAAARYARAFSFIADSREDTILCVCHEIPVRYAVNAAAGSPDLDHPLHDVRNATPYLFDEATLRRAADNLARSGR
ncbi:MAG TPA: histidine phosphatase family protein [Acidimicrobiales bacterium]|nr:histidine phosphatase family protein [Acidimicrobiales bacterium]